MNRAYLLTAVLRKLLPTHKANARAAYRKAAKR